MGEVPVNKVNIGNKGLSVLKWNALQWNANGLHSMGYGADNKPGIYLYSRNMAWYWLQ